MDGPGAGWTALLGGSVGFAAAKKQAEYRDVEAMRMILALADPVAAVAALDRALTSGADTVDGVVSRQVHGVSRRPRPVSRGLAPVRDSSITSMEQKSL